MSEVYPLISVLVLCYNNQKYLYESLESIFSQSYPNLELLINDDASLDFDGNALDAWVSKNKTSNITSVFINHSQTNCGTTVAVHYLQTIANGIWLFNIAADDVLYDQNVIMSMYNTAVHRGDNAQVIMAQTLMYDNTLSKVIQPFMSKQDIEFLKTASMEQLLSRTAESAWLPASYLYNRSILCYIDDICKDYKLVEDIPAHLRLIGNGIRPYFCDITSSIKHRDGGVSHSSSEHPTSTQLLYKQDLVRIFEKDIISYKDLISNESMDKAAWVYMHTSRDNFISHLCYASPSIAKRATSTSFSVSPLYILSRKKLVISYFVIALILLLIGLLSTGFSLFNFATFIKYLPFTLALLAIIVCICSILINIYYRIKYRNR